MGRLTAGALGPTAAIAAIMPGCSVANDDAYATTSAPGQMAPTVLTVEDEGRELRVRVGEIFLVELPANRSTGFSWAFDGDPGAGVRLAEVTYRTDGTMPGTGGVDSFRFKAFLVGPADIHFVYRRPWDAIPARSVTLSLVVIH